MFFLAGVELKHVTVRKAYLIFIEGIDIPRSVSGN
jgi:hypothetical protein